MTINIISGATIVCASIDSFLLFAVNTVHTTMDLVKAARKGKEQAFLQLYDGHYVPLFRFAYRLSGSAPTLRTLSKNLSWGYCGRSACTAPQRTSLRFYLFRTVRNQALKLA